MIDDLRRFTVQVVLFALLLQTSGVGVLAAATPQQAEQPENPPASADPGPEKGEGALSAAAEAVGKSAEELGRQLLEVLGDAPPSEAKAVVEAQTETAAPARTAPPSPPWLAQPTSLASSGSLSPAPAAAETLVDLSQVALVAGANLLSLPSEPADPDPAVVLAPIAGQYSAAYAYDACDAADPWKLYDPADAAASDLAAIDHRLGVWLDADAATALPSPGTQPPATAIQLCTGWNLIGYPLAEPRPVPAALASIAGKYLRVFGYAAAEAGPQPTADPWEVYDVAVPAWANDLTAMQPGRGYWVLATEDVVLDMENQGAPPEVAIETPTVAAEIAGPETVLGSVRSNLLERWTLAYRPSGTGEPFVELAAGNVPVESAELGAFDPTLLLNGMYDLRLEARDFAGQTVETIVPVVVDGQRKVGLFTLSFSDLAVPLSGLDIEVVRTYDSRDKSRGDFGVGWRLEIRQGTYRNNVSPGDGWQIVASQPPNPFPCAGGVETQAHLTTVRLSDQEVYRFRLALANTGPSLGGCVGRAHFEYVDGPVPGATLEILGNTDVFWPSGNDYLLDGITQEVYEPEQVRLATRDGREFDLSLRSGVMAARDPNGNELTITPLAIAHSSGASIAIERDAANRIAAITDPSGERRTYSYDASGDLVAYTDAAGHTTTFAYNGEHGMLDLVDPLGNRAVRNEYDEAGRLIATTDAGGNTIQFSRDLEARREIVTDRLGHTRVLEYDARGNVTREVDEAGEETLRTFDGDDNLLTETDPLGRTTTYTYTPAHDVASITDPLGNATAFTYDAAGRLLTTTDPRSNATTNVYDSAGNLTETTDAAGAATTFAYDAQGNLLTETDALSGVTTHAYDARGNLTATTDALGNETTFTYDANGNRLTESLTRTIPGVGGTPATTETLTTTFTYDELSRLLSTTAADGSTTRQTYDALGRVVSRSDALGRVTTLTYDERGRLTTTTFPDATSESSTHDDEGRVTSRTDRGGRVTSFSYDPVGRLVATTFGDGSSTIHGYDDAGQLVSRSDERGNTTTFVYDDAGRRTEVTDALGHTTTFAYDAAGNQTSVTDARGLKTEFTYDALNRRTVTTLADGETTSTGYDTLGRRVSETDQAGRTTTFGYDALGRLTSVTDALGQATTFSYDEVGNRLTQTDANGNTTTFGYDAVGRQVSRALPDGAVERMAYNADGTLASRTDFQGRTTTFTYDVAGRLVGRSHPDATSVAWAYTATGQRASFTDGRGTTAFTYDERDRVTSTVYPDGRRLEYGYDLAGNRTSLTATVGAVVLPTTYGYDALNRLATVTDTSGGEYTHGYDAVGSRTSMAYPNGVTTSTTYDAVNRLSLLATADSGGATLQSYAFTLDVTGRRTRIDEADGTARAYTYDALYRLTQDRVTDGAAALVYQEGFTYDAVGNRTELARDEGAGAVTTAYTYDSRDRLTAEGAAAHSWDATGNLTAKAGTATYGWDTQDRLTTATLTDGTTVVTHYDPDGNRVRTETTPPGGATEVVNYLVDTSGFLSHVVVESDGAGNVLTHYTRGDELLSLWRPASSERKSFHADGLGSVRLLTDATGTVTDSYTYTAFGVLENHTGTDVQPYRFTGEPFDPNLGFQYHRARWLDVRVGRFASVDPFAGSLEDPISLHRYLYANADPVGVVDPSGEFSLNSLAVNLAVRATLFTMRHPVLTAVIGILANALVPAELGEALYASGNPFGVGFGSVSIGKARFFALVKSARFRAFVNRNRSLAGKLWRSNGLAFEDFLRDVLKARGPIPVGTGRHTVDIGHRTVLIEAKTGRTLSGREIEQLKAIAGDAAQNSSGFVYTFLFKPTAAAIRKVEEAGGTALWFFENVGG